MSDISQPPVAADLAHPRHAFAHGSEAQGWPLLDALGERLAEALETGLQQRFHVPLSVRAAERTSLDQAAFIDSLAPLDVCRSFALEPLATETWLVVDRALSWALVDRRYGGRAPLDVADPLPAQFSTTERRAFEHVTTLISESLKVAWAPIEGVDVLLDTTATRERLVLGSTKRRWHACAFDIDIDGHGVQLRIVYPRAMLDALGSRLSVPEQTGGAETTDERLSLQSGLLGCDIEIEATLAETEITLGRLLALAPGDFLAFERHTRVQFHAAGKPVFDAAIGTSNGRLSASVQQVHLAISN